MSTKKPFKELSKSGQKYRLDKYEKERAAKGTKQCLATVVQKPKFVQLDNGDTNVYFRFACFDATSNTEDFKNMSLYLKKDNTDYRHFLEGIKVGGRYAVEYKENGKNGKYNNVYSLFERPRAAK